MKKILFILAIATLAIPYTLNRKADAQGFTVAGPSYRDVVFTADFVKDDTAATALESPAILCKYIGDQESGTLDMNSNALEFFSGPLGSEVIDGTTGYDVNTGDVCGTTNDSLDVTDTECDTAGELVNVVNDSGAPWVCVLNSVLSAESTSLAADFVDPADQQCKQPGGCRLVLNNDSGDTLAVLLRPDIGSGRARNNPNTQDRDDIEAFLTPPAAGSYTQTLLDNPFGGRRAQLTYAIANVDSTSAWQFDVYCVRYKRSGRRVDRLVFSTTATTDATDLSLTQFNNAPLSCGPDEIPLLYVVDDALVTAQIGYQAEFWPIR